jgi:hypothetical protein
MRACAFVVGIVVCHDCLFWGRIISHKIVLCRRIQYGSLQVHQFACNQPFSSALCLIASDASSLPHCSSLFFHSIVPYFFTPAKKKGKKTNLKRRCAVARVLRTAICIIRRLRGTGTVIIARKEDGGSL